MSAETVTDIDQAINDVALGVDLYRNVSFPVAGQEVLVLLDNTYFESEVVPNGNYRVKVVAGDRRASIRKGSTAWTWEHAYFVSDKSEVFADILIHF